MRVTHGSIAGSPGRHVENVPHGASQNSRFRAASSVAFVPGVPQFGVSARPHGAGLAQGGLREAGRRQAGAERRGTGICSRAHNSRAPS
jgi:hypothetical protein